jgi:hypothetical protein
MLLNVLRFPITLKFEELLRSSASLTTTTPGSRPTRSFTLRPRRSSRSTWTLVTTSARSALCVWTTAPPRSVTETVSVMVPISSRMDPSGNRSPVASLIPLRSYFLKPATATVRS